MTEDLHRCLNLWCSFRWESDLPELLCKQGHGVNRYLGNPAIIFVPLTATVFSTTCGSPLHYSALPLPLLDGWGAQHRPDGFIKHRFKATLRQSWALQILHWTCLAEEKVEKQVSKLIIIWPKNYFKTWVTMLSMTIHCKMPNKIFQHLTGLRRVHKISKHIWHFIHGNGF